MKGGERSPPNRGHGPSPDGTDARFNEGRGTFPAKLTGTVWRRLLIVRFNEGRGTFPAKSWPRPSPP